ncbi:uncharacterized protein [Ptychodera flava]|uniref:uncharacterized protein n=1 Tax=Ptychodera flava TaxID=63121 RepID=UPI00396AAEBD
MQNIQLAFPKNYPAENEGTLTRKFVTLGVHTGSVKVFENLQMFADHMNSLMQIEDVDVYLKYENIEYQAFHTKTTDLMMESLVVNSNHGRSRRNIEESSGVLKTKLTFTSDVTVVVAFVYHNPLGILPVNVKKVLKRQTGKPMKKKEQAINSPVVMIRTYSRNNVNLKRNSLELDIPHRQPAYKSKCVTMQFDKPKLVWKYKECSLVKAKSTKYSTSCLCSQPTIVALDMTIGERPLTFIVAARDGAIMAANCLSFLLTLLSTVFIVLSG